jgi:hypothetical protein
MHLRFAALNLDQLRSKTFTFSEQVCSSVLKTNASISSYLIKHPSIFNLITFRDPNNSVSTWVVDGVKKLKDKSRSSKVPSGNSLNCSDDLKKQCCSC